MRPRLCQPTLPVAPAPAAVRSTSPGPAHLIGARVDLLLGTDIRSDAPFLLDWQNGCATFPHEEMPLHGCRVKTRMRLGIPCLEFELAGSPHRAFLDTGAKLSYMDPAAVNGAPPIGDTEDFFPTIGAFRTKVYQKEISLTGTRFNARFGVLPDMLSMALAMTGVRWILGNEILREGSVLFELGKNRLTFAAGRVEADFSGGSNQRIRASWLTARNVSITGAL